jgi:hypothetical protein
VYLRLDVGMIDWSRGRYLIGIDSWDAALGDKRLPYTRTPSPVGLEFVLDLHGPEGSHLLVDSPYALYRHEPIRGAHPPATQSVYNRPFRTRANADARYDTLWVTPNRRRLGRDGTVFPAQRLSRNRLAHAREQETTLADWYADPVTGTIEVRIPWGMLHVLDPSSRTVLFGNAGASLPAGRTTVGFRFVVESFAPGASPDAAMSGDRLPRGTDAPFGPPPVWSWPTWEQPRWYAERKPAFEAMRETFERIPERPRS